MSSKAEKIYKQFQKAEKEVKAAQKKIDIGTFNADRKTFVCVKDEKGITIHQGSNTIKLNTIMLAKLDAYAKEWLSVEEDSLNDEPAFSRRQRIKLHDNLKEVLGEQHWAYTRGGEEFIAFDRVEDYFVVNPTETEDFYASSSRAQIHKKYCDVIVKDSKEEE